MRLRFATILLLLAGILFSITAFGQKIEECSSVTVLSLPPSSKLNAPHQNVADEKKAFRNGLSMADRAATKVTVFTDSLNTDAASLSALSKRVDALEGENVQLKTTIRLLEQEVKKLRQSLSEKEKLESRILKLEDMLEALYAAIE